MKIFSFKSLAMLFLGGLIAVMLNIASCGGGEETTQAVNNPPVAVNDVLNVVQSSMTNLNLAVNDSDADDGMDLASITIVSAPAHASGPVVVKSDGTVDYTHDGTATTSDTFTYTIKDKSGAVSNIATVTLTIRAEPVNNPPVAVNDALNAVQNSMTNLNLAVNDSDADDGLDLASITIVSAPAHAIGPVVVKSDGTVNYTHDGSATTSDTFTYTIKDNSGAVSNIATVTLKISAVPVNNPPVAENDALSADHGTTTNLDLADNDYDADDGLNLASIAVETDPSHGTIVNNFNGTVDYIHNGTATISDTFTYTIKDITGAVSNTATVTLTIVTNNPPVANAGADKTVVPGQTVILDGSDSSDPDGDGLTFYWDLQSKPAQSSSLFTSTSENPSFTPDFYGSYTVRLVVNDGTVDSPADTVVVTATTAGQRKYDAACASCHKAGRYDPTGSASNLYNNVDNLTTDLSSIQGMRKVPDITPQEVIDLKTFLQDPLIAP